VEHPEAALAPEPTSGANLNAGVLRRIARLAHDRIPQVVGDREAHSDMDAVVAVSFSAASIEAFINELSALAATTVPRDPPAITAFLRLVREVERARGTTRLKYLVASQAFTGAPYD
jgi:hypothetical protein